MVIYGPDLSHYQTINSWAQIGASRDFVILKATESVAVVKKRLAAAGKPKPKTVRPVVQVDGVRHVLKPRFVDPTVSSRRTSAHNSGLLVGLYHFARAGNAVAEATYFLSTVGALRDGEFVVLDQEVVNSVAWCKQWLDTVYAKTGVRPLIYMNQSASTGLGMGNWSSVAASYGLWLARYDNAPGTINSVPYWGAPAMKQYSDKGTTPGVAGTCDVNVFYGTVDQLRAFCKGGSAPTPPPPPPPIVLEDDMPAALVDPSGTVWKYTMFGMRRLDGSTPADVAISGGLQAIAGKAPTPVTWDQLNALSGECDADRAALLKQVQAWVLGADPGTDPKGWLLAQVSAIAETVKSLQTGGVDPKAVVGGVLAGLNGAQLNVQQPAAPAA